MGRGREEMEERGDLGESGEVGRRKEGRWREIGGKSLERV